VNYTKEGWGINMKGLAKIFARDLNRVAITTKCGSPAFMATLRKM